VKINKKNLKKGVDNGDNMVYNKDTIEQGNKET
jgi:hypothetical protein